MQGKVAPVVIGPDNAVYLLDEAGHEFKDPSQLPKTIGDLRDDPYRRLAWMVREKGGYHLTGAFFAEFQWANFRLPELGIELVMNWR